MGDIRQHCSDEWPTDYKMQEYCIGRQVKAADLVIKEYNAFVDESEEKNIYNRCFNEWRSSSGGYDWVMVEYCKTQQLEAYRRLGTASHRNPKSDGLTDSGKYDDWYLFLSDQNDLKICYAASEPTMQSKEIVDRGSPAVLVAYTAERPASVTVRSGFLYREESEVVLTIDDRNPFYLFTKGEYAWTKTEQDDEAIIDAMKEGISLIVRSASAAGSIAVDSYSLMGFTDASNAAIALCEK